MKDYESCWVNCNGLYADVVHNNATVSQTFEDRDTFEILIEAYNTYKSSKVGNLEIGNWDSHYRRWIDGVAISAPYHPLQVVQIFFDTPTYDEIEKDVSVTFGDQLGAIGGTLGLFAGFSIISGVEILYFLIKAFLSFVSKKKQNPAA